MGHPVEWAFSEDWENVREILLTVDTSTAGLQVCDQAGGVLLLAAGECHRDGVPGGRYLCS